jgi:hypothetical protein
MVWEVAGESKGKLMGVPEVRGSQSQDNPGPYSINLVALSLSWPKGKKEKSE